MNFDDSPVVCKKEGWKCTRRNIVITFFCIGLFCGLCFASTLILFIPTVYIASHLVETQCLVVENRAVVKICQDTNQIHHSWTGYMIFCYDVRLTESKENKKWCNIAHKKCGDSYDEALQAIKDSDPVGKKFTCWYWDTATEFPYFDSRKEWQQMLIFICITFGIFAITSIAMLIEEFFTGRSLRETIKFLNSIPEEIKTSLTCCNRTHSDPENSDAEDIYMA